MWVQILFLKFPAQLLYFLIFLQNFVSKLYARIFFPNFLQNLSFLFSDYFFYKFDHMSFLFYNFLYRPFVFEYICTSKLV